MKTPSQNSLDQLLKTISKDLGHGYIHLALSWLDRAKIVIDKKINLPNELMEFLSLRAFLKIENLNSPEMISTLSIKDLLICETYPSIDAYCKVLTTDDSPQSHGHVSFLKLTSSQLALLKQLETFSSYDLISQSQTPTLFLDRDGVIIDHVAYIKNTAEVSLKDGIVDLIQRYRSRGYRIVMITNQSGIGRELFSFKDFVSIQTQTLKLLASQGQWIDACYYSSYYEKAQTATALRYPSLRKPSAGIIAHEIDLWNTHLEQSLLVGDNITDIELAHNARIGTSFLIKNDNLPQSPMNNNLKFKTIEKLSEIN